MSEEKLAKAFSEALIEMALLEPETVSKLIRLRQSQKDKEKDIVEQVVDDVLGI